MNPDRLGAVVVRPLLPSNLGSIARACKNFGVRDLRLVEPAAETNEDSERLASGAGDVLDGLRRFASLPLALADFEAVVATSSLRGRASHRAIRLGELPGFLQELGQSRVALVFGSEKSGLTEEEMSHASVFLRLPTVPEFPTLNVSHAVAITLSAACLAGDESPAAGEPWAAAKDIEGAIEHWDRALDAIGFYDTGHHDRTLRDWRRIVAGRPLAERDVKILRGVANRIMVSLRRKTEPGSGKRETENEAP